MALVKQNALWFATGGGASRMLAVYQCRDVYGNARPGVEEDEIFGNIDAPHALPAGCDITTEAWVYGAKSFVKRDV
jgi:hypothetical protein